MTIDENRNPRVQYNGPIEINDELAITFPYAEKEDVACQLNEELLRYSIDYTILGQTLTIKVAAGQADTVTIYRTTPLDQQAEFPQNNRFNSAKLNESLDKICMQQQEQSEMINRCTKVPITFMNFDGAIPYPQANKALKINSEATGFTLSDYDPDEAIVVTEQYKSEAVVARDEAIKQQQEATNQANLAKEWATSETMVQGIDYSSKYYAQKSEEQAQIATDKTTEVVASGNTALTNIENAESAALTAISNQQQTSVSAVNTAGATQIALATEQANIATEQATIATEQATIATNKASEVVASGNGALANIDTAKDNAITSITNQETTSKTVLIDEGATQIGLIKNEGATQVANVQSTGFYMRDDKLYYINSQGEETEFKSGGSGLEVCDIGMALYVDETKGLRRYLNGQILDINTNTQAFLNRLKEITTLYPSLLCTEDEWQTEKTMSAFGQVGKFVFNYSGENIVSVRLPRVVNVQGLFDLQNLGMTVSAGLPNITGTINNVGNASGITLAGTGCFNVTSLNAGAYAGGGGRANEQGTINFNASRSSAIYGNSDTVQPEAIQYPYFIQIATGSETEANIVNTLENVNGFTLLESKYSDKPLYNESWLLSNGQWNAKSVYPTVYEGLQVEYNSEIEVGTTVTLPSGVSYTKRGLSVKLSTEEYTDYDFVLNTAEETFRLPLKTKQKFYDDIAPVVGNGIALGTTDGTHFGALANNGSLQYFGSGIGYGNAVGQPANNTTQISMRTVGVTTDPTKSGIETHLTETTLYLYYYVGDIDQNHGIVNMGRIGEQLANKTDMLQASGASMPSDKYINLTLGASGSTYTAPANGYFYIRKISSGAGQSLWFQNASAGNLAGPYTKSTANNEYLSAFVPVKKGQKAVIEYTLGGATQFFRFIYAEGSK